VCLINSGLKKNYTNAAAVIVIIVTIIVAVALLLTISNTKNTQSVSSTKQPECLGL